MQKPFMFIILVTIAVIVLVILIVPSTPKVTEELPETEIVASTEQDTEEVSISETDETDIEELIQDAHESSKTDTNVTSEELKYIGRQIRDYEEPQTENIHIRVIESQLRYRNTYQSNIVIVLDDIAHTNIDGYEWFDYAPKPTSAFHKAAQFVCYAILTYYDGKVPCDYYVNLEEDKYNENGDIHNGHPQSSMIFEVQTHGDKPLNICLDMYNYKIRVDEGVSKESPDCKFGCCN